MLQEISLEESIMIFLSVLITAAFSKRTEDHNIEMNIAAKYNN